MPMLVAVVSIGRRFGEKKNVESNDACAKIKYKQMDIDEGSFLERKKNRENHGIYFRSSSEQWAYLCSVKSDLSMATRCVKDTEASIYQNWNVKKTFSLIK